MVVSVAGRQLNPLVHGAAPSFRRVRDYRSAATQVHLGAAPGPPPSRRYPIVGPGNAYRWPANGWLYSARSAST